jgi:hypothetical protein
VTPEEETLRRAVDELLDPVMAAEHCRFVRRLLLAALAQVAVATALLVVFAAVVRAAGA